MDLVLAGHSHSYERSFLIDGHYGSSTTFAESMKKDGGDGRADGTGAYQKPSLGPAPHEGAVYVVAGSSGQTSGGLLNHPAMYLSLNLLGSLVLDVSGPELNAKFLNSDGVWRDYFTIRKGAGAPPSAPSDLVASAVAASEIDLGWVDNASDEDSFVIERSLDGNLWQEVGTTGANVNTFMDTGLAPLTTYFYRVRARNSFGDSGYSNTASATTPSAGVMDEAPNGEMAVDGQVTGTYQNTQTADGVYESIQETESKGKHKSRYSLLEHKWTIDVTGGSAVTFFVKAYQSPSTDGDHFDFAYSTDNSTFTQLLTVTKTSDDGAYQAQSLPASLRGRVYIRVRDTVHSAGQRAKDTVFVDHMFIRSE